MSYKPCRDINKVPGFDDIIFNLRNKQYGAYNLRKKYNFALLIACVSGIILLSAAVIIPFLRSAGKENRKASDEKQLVFVAMEQIEPPDNEMVRIYAPPPPSQEQIQQVRYIAPEVIDSLVQKDADRQIMTMEESLQNVRDEEVAKNIVYSWGGEWVDGVPTGEGTSFIVEEMPSFQGKGVNRFREYISRNLVYPQEAVKKNISGRVIVQFIINSKGEIENVVVVRGVDPMLDQEAVRVVSSSPKWEPGKQRGKPVNVLFTFPISFRL
jgi:protein TonB